MSEIRIELQACGEKLPPKTSKIFGCPDVTDAEKFEIPTFDCWGTEHDMTFIAQINCSELAEFDPDCMLPHEGMLYFFYNTAKMAATPGEEDGAGVIYDGNCTGKTQILELYDENGSDVSVPEIKMVFSAPIEGTKSDYAILPTPEYNEEADALFAELEGIVEDVVYEDGANDEVILLQLRLLGLEEEVPEFGELLCFFISKKRLLAKDFSDVSVMII